MYFPIDIFIIIKCCPKLPLEEPIRGIHTLLCSEKAIWYTETQLASGVWGGDFGSV